VIDERPLEFSTEGACRLGLEAAHEVRGDEGRAVEQRLQPIQGGNVCSSRGAHGLWNVPVHAIAAANQRVILWLGLPGAGLGLSAHPSRGTRVTQELGVAAQHSYFRGGRESAGQKRGMRQRRPFQSG